VIDKHSMLTGPLKWTD